MCCILIKPLTFAPRFEGMGNRNRGSTFRACLRGGKRRKGGFKKTKKSFGEAKNWITFAELSPEKTGRERIKREHTNREVH